MNWWDLVAEKKHAPFVAPEREVPGNFRFPAAILCGLAGFVLLLVGVVGAFAGATPFALWSIGTSIVLAICAGLLIPAERSRRK